MPTLLASNFLNRYPIDQAMRHFARLLPARATVVDIGCGYKPYAKYFTSTYIGVDHDHNSAADIVADSTDVPLADGYADGVVLNQTLEHTEGLTKTLDEIWRLLKPGGLLIITVPLIMKVHSVPLPRERAPHRDLASTLLPNWQVDYWRFTKFGLTILFKRYKIITLKETSGYVATLLQLINYFFSSFGLPYLFVPLYLVNNLLGYTVDKVVKALVMAVPLANLTKFYQLIYMSLPLNYVLLARKPGRET